MQYKTVELFGDQYDVEYSYSSNKPVITKICLAHDKAGVDLTDLLKEKFVSQIEDKFFMTFAWAQVA